MALQKPIKNGMKTKPIWEFEGTDFEKEIDDYVSDMDWCDRLFLDPDGNIIEIKESVEELFFAQNPDLTGWTQILFGIWIED